MLISSIISRAPSDFYFNIDSAWNEIMYVYNWFSQFTFSFTTYTLHNNNGVWTKESVIHIFKLMDFITAFFVFTTVDNIVFWWNHRGEFDPYDGDYDVY